MKVLKFGGTSVGSVEALTNVKNIVEANEEEVVVVVSAFSGVTDTILNMSRKACMRDLGYKDMFAQIVDRHNGVIDAMIRPEERESVKKQVEPLFEELGNLLQGVYLVKDLSQKIENAVVSYGEQLSSIIVSRIIDGAKLIDSRTFIKTKPYYSKHSVDFGITSDLIKKTFAVQPQIAVVPGFISSDCATGETTTLGRGGSDYTASIIASVLNASMLEIWTDVDGFMTADPRIINNAYVIENISFIEAMELCNFGAKVIYPPTIFPVYHKNIPIYIKNTFNPSAKGTYIHNKSSKHDVNRDLSKAIKGISSINDTALLTVEGLGMVGIIGVNYRIFKALSKAGISVFFVSQASSENTTSIGVSNEVAHRAAEVLHEEFAKEIAMGEINRVKIKQNLATVAIVGENMRRRPGVAGKLFNTLGRNGINVIACAQGASETNISFIVDLEVLRKTLNVIHDSFFLSEYQVLNIFVAGVGTVGNDLLSQIQKQQSKLLEQNALKINVVGISNSRKCIFAREGIDLATYREQLENSSLASSPELLVKEITDMNIFNSVFVDCTASDKIPPIYKTLLEHNVSVVTANKIAASGKYENYQELKTIARSNGIKFLFETNVGAGLPIINTINSLINSGDRILKIEAVLSGTLNFIFNNLSKEIPFSKTIALAKEAGYSEPDPRLDLNGLDVIRKIVILSREAGYRINIEDVKKELFVPQKYFDGSLEDFWKTIGDLDEDFDRRHDLLQAENKRWRFVAKLEAGVASVGLQEVDPDNPLYHLEGSNNVILLTTERYKEYPMMIKGYGAGASVTAAGVFADIISIANIR